MIDHARPFALTTDQPSFDDITPTLALIPVPRPLARLRAAADRYPHAPHLAAVIADLRTPAPAPDALSAPGHPDQSTLGLTAAGLDQAA